MQKYILILTKAEYVEAFQQYVTIKMEQEFDIDFILIEDEQFCTFDKFKTFVRSKNPDGNPNKAFFLLIGGSEFYYGLSPLLGDFQYAQCSELADDMSMYCTVGRIPGRNIAEIKDTCEKVLNCKSIKTSLMNQLPIVATVWNRNFWKREFPNLVMLDTTNSAPAVVSKQKVIEEITKNNFIIHMGHGNRFSLVLRYGCYLRLCDIQPLPSEPLHIWAWACSTCKTDSLGENCLLQGKAVSFWGARNITYGKSNRILCKSFMQELFNPTTAKSIGEIYLNAVMVKALRDFNLGDDRLLNNAMKYTFLGDPTMLVTF